MINTNRHAAVRRVLAVVGLSAAVVGLTSGDRRDAPREWSALFGVRSAIAAEFQAGPLRVIDPKSTPSRPGSTTLGAYVTISNRGPSADTLLRASTPVAGSVEIHTMKMDGDVMKMREIGPVDVAVGQTLTMGAASPDGLHLMLMGVKQTLKVGDVFPLTLEFKNAGRAEVTVTVTNDARGTAAGASGGAMSGSDMSGHKH